MSDPTPQEIQKTLSDEHQWILTGIRYFLSGDPSKLGDHIVECIKAHDDPVSMGMFLSAMFGYTAINFHQICTLMEVDTNDLLDTESMWALEKSVTGGEEPNEQAQTTPE